MEMEERDLISGRRTEISCQTADEYWKEEADKPTCDDIERHGLIMEYLSYT